MNKRLCLIVLTVFTVISFLSEKADAVAPTFLPGIYQVSAEEDSASASFYFQINDPDPGAYDSLIGSVSGVNNGLLESVSLSKFMDEGSGISLWKLVFVPRTDINGTDDLQVTISDGTGQSTKDMTITITPLNDAPILHNGGNNIADMKMPDIPMSGIADQNVTEVIVQEIIASSTQNNNNAIVDVDGDPEGIAVIGINSDHGKWEYSVDGGFTWHSLDGVSETNAVLLGGNDKIKFTRHDGWSGIIEQGLEIKAWDHSQSISDTTDYAQIPPPRDKNPFSKNTEYVKVFACPSINKNFCYDVNNPSNSLNSMINGTIGAVFTAGTFPTDFGNVTIQSNGNFTYSKGVNFTCADSFDFTASPGGGCPVLQGTAYVLQPICAGGGTKIELDQAIYVLQVISGMRP